MGWATVCADVELAAVAMSHGADVVLCGTDATAVGNAVVRLRPAGRVAALIGDLDDPAVETAAVAMAAELFGGQPVVVRTRSDVRQPNDPRPA